jgi:hypothetical protein
LEWVVTFIFMVRSRVQAMLASQVQGVLATVGRNLAPATALMAFATNRDSSVVYLATHVAARKALNMLERPTVSLLWDNRTGNLADHGEGVLVTAGGVAALLPAAGEDALVARASFEAKNPNMARFLATDGVGLFAVTVDEYEVVVGYERPQAWVPSGVRPGEDAG